MTKEEQEKFHQQLRGKKLKAVVVKVLPGDHKRLYQERVGQCVVNDNNDNTALMALEKDKKNVKKTRVRKAGRKKVTNPLQVFDVIGSCCIVEVCMV